MERQTGISEESQPTEPDGRLPEPPQPPKHDKNDHDSKKPHIVTWMVLLFALLLLAAGGMAYYTWRNSGDPVKTSAGNAKPDEDRAQVNAEANDGVRCGNGLSAYQSEKFGFSFCYPASWGGAALADDKFDPDDKGSRWVISFPGKPAVKVAFVSDDWSTSVARDGTCSTPVQEVDYGGFSTAWQTQGGADITYAERGISAKANEYSIEEYVDSLLTNGVCLKGYATINSGEFTHITTSFFAPYNQTIATPGQHIGDPNALIPESEREAITGLVLSIKEYGS